MSDDSSILGKNAVFVNDSILDHRMFYPGDSRNFYGFQSQLSQSREGSHAFIHCHFFRFSRQGYAEIVSTSSNLFGLKFQLWARPAG